MNLLTIIIFFIGFLLFVYCYKNKVVFRFDTLFRKGFKVNKDTFGVYCFTGKQGTGKTYSVIDFISSVRSKDTKVITNVKSYADNNKEFVIYEENFYNIVNGFKSGRFNTNYIIFFDEIFTLIEKGKLDKKILSFLSQLRKRGIYFVTTAQEWLEINVTFRRYVRYQVECSLLNIPILGAFSVNAINDGYQIHWDNLENEYVSPRLKTTIKKCSLKIANSYDTYEVINES